MDFHEFRVPDDLIDEHGEWQICYPEHPNPLCPDHGKAEEDE